MQEILHKQVLHMASGRKSTDSNASQPAFKVVGFHVEGVPPSPDQVGLLQDALNSGGGSPDPVIIPPSFQVTLYQSKCQQWRKLN